MTATQIATARQGGFATVQADVAALVAGSLAEEERLARKAAGLLADTGRVVVHSAEGPLGQNVPAAGAAIGAALGRVSRTVVRQSGIGRLRGFQLWINLPAREKMKPASYRDIAPEAIARSALAGGGEVKVIAGTLSVDGRRVAGPIQGVSTEPLFVDVRLPAGTVFACPLTVGQRAFVYVYEGGLSICAPGEARALATHEAGVLSDGDEVCLRAECDAAFLLLAATPLGEPVVQYGPFVMNNRDEIEQAIADYRNGQLV